MSVCQKCWSDALGNADRYSKLIDERKNNPCTPEEQAGREATECSKCKRITIHEITGECMACGYIIENYSWY
jgi:ribosomal protein L37E